MKSADDQQTENRIANDRIEEIATALEGLTGEPTLSPEARRVAQHFAAGEIQLDERRREETMPVAWIGQHGNTVEFRSPRGSARTEWMETDFVIELEEWR